MTAPLAFYNEHDPKAAAWLRELIAQGHIAPGVVDERSISDIAPDELAGFTQCHFFAGIGVWPLALRAAGWADDRPIWTGSCPCQPFSAAGKGDGFDDERHLWPHWHWLIQQRRPPIIAGEQVASKDALLWLDLVSADLEEAGYAFGAADLCAAGAGLESFGESVWGERLSRAIHLCPDPLVAGALRDFADFARQHLGGERGGHHIRQRSYFAGVADPERLEWIGGRSGEARGQSGPVERAERLRDAERLADDNGGGFSGPGGCCAPQEQRATELLGVGGLVDPNGGNASAARIQRCREHGRQPQNGGPLRAGSGGLGDRGDAGMGADASNRRRGDADWLFCRDGKWRPAEPGTFPLAHAAPARVGRLRGYGNALDFETVLAWVETVKAHLDGAAVERIAA